MKKYEVIVNSSLTTFELKLSETPRIGDWIIILKSKNKNYFEVVNVEFTSDRSYVTIYVK